MKAQGVDITKEQAGQVTTKEECDRFISAVESVIYRDKKYITQREQEVVRLKEILETLKQRHEFLTIGSGTIEVGQWYEHRRYNNTSCRTIKIESGAVVFIRFELLEGNKVYRYHNKNYVLIPLPTGEAILNPPVDDYNNVVGIHHCYKVMVQTEYVRNRNSFLENWIPSCKLEIVVKNPSTIEADGVIEEMIVQNNPHSIVDAAGDELQRSVILAKYNDKGWHIVFTMESGL